MTAPSIGSRLLPRLGFHSGQEDEAPPPGAGELLRLMMYGHARVELTQLTRPDGAVARQMVWSVGLPPIGRLATRMTLNDFSGMPTAIHGEVILGWKPFSVGASLGRSRKEIIVTWFRRYQPSILTTNREITRLVVRGRNAEVQHLEELKLYGRSLSTLEIGRAHTVQFSREHYREARASLQREGSVEASAFLRRHYPHVDEGFLRQTLRRPRFSAIGFGLELAATYGAAWGLSHYLDEGPLRHAAQNGAAYALASVFRQGLGGLAPARLSGAVAEALPLALIHGGLAAGADAVGLRFPGRWLAEDFGSLAIYGYARGVLFPRFLATAAVAETRLLASGSLAAEARLASRLHWGLTAALLLGVAVYAQTRPAVPLALSWEEFEARHGDAERKRWNLRPGPCDHHWAVPLVARILDGGSEGPLQEEINRIGPRLGRALERISPGRREELAASLGENGLRELLSLSRECDPELFWEGLLHLARRLERAEKFQGAAMLRYPILIQNEFPGIRQRARQDQESFWV
ncbi:MAG TPA: hypothetical protein VJR29_06650 [bacterium]|nr:hypothetical protein [bacterium]